MSESAFIKTKVFKNILGSQLLSDIQTFFRLVSCHHSNFVANHIVFVSIVDYQKNDF